jgi:hypothetical protein
MLDTAWEPLIARVPDQAPDAEQLEALMDDHVKVELLPLAIFVGPALRDTVGAVALTETVTELDAVPPKPVHPSTNFVFALSATVD